MFVAILYSSSDDSGTFCGLATTAGKGWGAIKRHRNDVKWRERSDGGRDVVLTDGTVVGGIMPVRVDMSDNFPI